MAAGGSRWEVEPVEADFDLFLGWMNHGLTMDKNPGLGGFRNGMTQLNEKPARRLGCAVKIIRRFPFSHGGSPSYHPFIEGFSIINHPFSGSPILGQYHLLF